MTEINVQVRGIDEVQRGLAKLLRQTSNLSEPMRQIALYIETENVQRFEEQRSPEGAPWQPSQRAIQDNGQTLVDTGRLRQSIKPDFGPLFARVTSGPLPYAAIHQTGGIAGRGARIPARPYMGIADDERRNVLRILDRYFEKITRQI